MSRSSKTALMCSAGYSCRDRAYRALSPSRSMAALGVTLIILAVIAIVISLALRSANKGRLSKSAVILTETESAEEGYVASGDMDVFLGKTGVTSTVLRPTGMAEFDGVKLNVQSDGEYIAKGETVRVDHVEGARVVVRRIAAQ